MTKIVYNDCYGGFGLSREAVQRGKELSQDSHWQCINQDWGFYDGPRHDPVLVQVVEELGDAASGKFAKLRIYELPSGVSYRIDEYDGTETVMTVDGYEWTTAP